MRRQGLLALVPLLALLAVTGDKANADEPIDPEIWVIGDSVGVGITGALRRYRVPLQGEAQISTNARQWLRWLRERRAWPVGRRFVVVSLGTNDGASQELRKEFSENARQIVEELTRRGHVVCWVLPPSAQSRVPSPSDLERLIQLNVSVVQERVAMADAWHPTAAGYDQLANVVRKVRANRR